MKKNVTLQCSGSTWCPTVEFKGREVSIKDDHGNKVKISVEQWNLLVEKVSKGELSSIKLEKK